MKLSLNWLNELVKIDAAPHDYIAAMTMSGSKVETLDYLGAEIENVVVGRLLSVEPHPDASKLVICQVDIGKEEKLQIVTGANNVSAGDLVPVALDGSKLPGGVEIHTGKLRGVESQGMLCSHQELGLTEHDIPDAPEHGILLLNGDEYAGIELGQDIRTVLGFDDHIVDFEITPNHPDCLSVIGLARESAATYDQHYEPEMATVKGAQALGRKTGRIAVGYTADLILVDFTKPNLIPCHDVAENLVYSAHGADVCLNMARGKVIYKDGQWLTIDMDRIRRELDGYAMPHIFG